MRFSVQQIKYEFLYAIKEFDSDGSLWQVVSSPRPPHETLESMGHDVASFIYLGKPAGTPRAATIVKTYFAERFDVIDSGVCEGEGVAEWVILFRSQKSLPTEANLLEPADTVQA